MKTSAFDLNVIAARLEGLEETIISKLIDRAQFRANLSIYEAGHSGFDTEPERSLFDIRLLYQEQMDAQFGRFCVPEERPFNSNLPCSKRKLLISNEGLLLPAFEAINLTKEILPRYLGLIPALCTNGDDGHYGSSVEHDIYAIQAIARRIHYGSLYVAESKFRSSPEQYTALINDRNAGQLMALLTRKEVEDRIIQRVYEKVIALQASVNQEVRFVIDPEVIVAFYRETVIPLTKKGEVLYLLNREISEHA